MQHLLNALVAKLLSLNTSTSVFPGVNDPLLLSHHLSKEMLFQRGTRLVWLYFTSSKSTRLIRMVCLLALDLCGENKVDFGPGGGFSRLVLHHPKCVIVLEADTVKEKNISDVNGKIKVKIESFLLFESG